MKYQDYTQTLPIQNVGSELEVSAEIQHDNDSSADNMFFIAKQRLLDINRWHETAGSATAVFRLTDANGNVLNRLPEEGDWVRIDIPGPGSSDGDGYDWVRVKLVREYQNGDVKSVVIQVSPTDNPQSEKSEVAHFYGDCATSTFAVNKVGLTVAAYVVDRNLVPNNEGSGTIDKIRNSVVGVAALGLFSRIQWQSLVDGIMANDR